MSRRTLGRGLQALLGIDELDAQQAVAVEPHHPQTHVLPSAAGAPVDPASIPGASDLAHVALDRIDVNPYQPRQDFEKAELQALAESVRTHGVIQPVVLRPMGDRYQLVAGERRLRAAREAGLSALPARIVDIDEKQTCELALIENLQRRDLNAMEKAQAFAGYLQKFGGTHEELASQLAVDRSTVTNLIRLLELPESVQEAVRGGKITNGHARALLSSSDPVVQIALCQRIIAESLSVRQTEALVKESAGAEPPSAKTAKSKEKDAPAKSNHILSLETDLKQRLGARVEIVPKSKDQGTIVIHFGSHDDFERVVACLSGRNADRL